MADDEYARFESMTNTQLRNELKQRGCTVSGNKKELLARLRLALQKEYEQQTINPIENSQNQTLIIDNNIDQFQSIDPVITKSEQIPIESNINSSLQTFNNLDNSNNIEANTVVSKSHENEERNDDRIVEETPLPSIGSSSSNAKSESIIKEISSIDQQQQQHTNQSEINRTIETEKNDVIQTIQLQSESIEEKHISKENELSENYKQSIVFNRSHISSILKISNRSTVNKINLTFELLQTLISDLNLLPESIVNAELDSEENNESIIETNITNDYLSSDSMTIGELADRKQTMNRIVAIDDSSMRKKQINSHPTRLSSFESKNNDIVTDEPVRIKEVHLSDEPPSEILYIRGLTRPFSLMQLKGLLNRYGKLVEQEFWLDKIKSQCFVTYQTLEDAQNARKQLDGCRWPSTNPKALSIRYARSEELEYSKIHDLPPDHMSTETTDRIVEESINQNDNEIESKNNFNEIQNEKISGFLITDEEVEEETIKSNEQRTKGGLDDYFRKTKSKPCIYWLPLTEEQIIERIRQRERRNAERDEERRKREIDENNRRIDKRKRSISPLKRDSKRH